MQVLEEEKTKLDAFCEQSLKNVSTNVFGTFPPYVIMRNKSTGHDTREATLWFRFGKTMFSRETLLVLSLPRSRSIPTKH